MPGVTIPFLAILFADGASFGHVGILVGVHLLSRQDAPQSGGLVAHPHLLVATAAMAATPPTAAVAVMEAGALAKGRQLRWLQQVCNWLELSHASTLYCNYAAHSSCTCMCICMQQIAHVHVCGMYV